MFPIPPRPEPYTGSRDRDRDSELERIMLPAPPRPDECYAFVSFRGNTIGVDSGDLTYHTGVARSVNIGYQAFIVSAPPALLRSQGGGRGRAVALDAPRTGRVPRRRPNVSGSTTTGGSYLLFSSFRCVDFALGNGRRIPHPGCAQGWDLCRVGLNNPRDLNLLHDL